MRICHTLMTRPRAAAIALLLWASACSSLPTGALPPTQARRSETTSASSAGDLATVQRVVDGDTFIALVGARRFRVRLIGVDTPETVKPNTPVQCGGPEASAYAKLTLTGKQVRLVYDVDRYDRYGRTLAYVYVGKTFFNLVLVQQGYAVVETVPPDVAHVGEFVAAQRTARAKRLGLWLTCAFR
jgi:micrococcal nuclease